MYPNTAKVARAVLGTPGTTVEMEREFGKASDLVVRKSGRLSAQRIRECMCLKSWIEAGIFDIVGYWEKREVSVRK